MHKKLKKRNMKTFRYKHQTIVGLFDSDGTIGVRILKRQHNKIGFNIVASFKQSTQNKDVLEPIAQELECKTIYSYGSDSRVDVALNTKAGQKLLKIFKKHPPFSPNKRKSYLLFLKIFEISQEIKRLSDEKKEKVYSIAAVFLAFQKENKKQTSEQIIKRQPTFEDWLDYLKPTEHQLKEGLELGKKYFLAIQNNVDYLKKYLTNRLFYKGKLVKCKLPPAYIVGFFIGDGSLYVSLNFRNSYRKCEIRSYFTMTEAAAGKELLYGFQSTFSNAGSISRTSVNENAFRYKVSGWVNCLNTILPILSKYQLPYARQQQFNSFQKTCIMGERADYRSKNGFFRIIDTFWEMKESGLNRKETKEEVFKHASIFFDQKEQEQEQNKRVFRNSLHIRLRNKYVTSKSNIRAKALRQKVKPIPLYDDTIIIKQ